MSGILLAASVVSKQRDPSTPDWTPWTLATGYSELIFSLPNTAQYEEGYVRSWDEWEGSNKTTVSFSLPQNALYEDKILPWEYWTGKDLSTLTVSIPGSAISIT